MFRTTREAIKAICATDPSITAEQVKAALAELEGEGVRYVMGESAERAYTREQVAALFGCAPKTITNYAKRGLLTPIFSGRQGLRAQAYTGASVRTLLDGKGKKQIKANVPAKSIVDDFIEGLSESQRKELARKLLGL